ncbi:hypothetical protein RRG08_005408 [Elysia crispata]|uniref:Uncharacterized protein n=1 Tax=Elysia crispata TaxID=231223 RepID=A0AAE0Y1W3_9GAST|nr:hypothetical protein RRG08_005408 [Elysia crispata]
MSETPPPAWAVFPKPATNDLTISETEKERIVRVARGCFLGIYVFLRLNLEIFCDFDGLAPVCAGVFTRNEPSQAAKLCPPFPTCSSRFSAVHATVMNKTSLTKAGPISWLIGHMAKVRIIRMKLENHPFTGAYVDLQVVLM